jgi:diaminopimelate epimerase
MVAGNMHLAAVDMGMAVRGFALAGSAKPVEQVELNAAGIAFSLALVATGNQHAVTFVDDVDAIALERLGPAIQSAAAFADPVNVHFVQRIDRRTLRMRPWERGSGATRACGTGACAAAFAAPDVDRLVTVIQPGGSVFVHLDWLGDDKASCRVHMIGSAGLVETGDWNPPG